MVAAFSSHDIPKETPTVKHNKHLAAEMWAQKKEKKKKKQSVLFFLN